MPSTVFQDRRKTLVAIAHSCRRNPAQDNAFVLNPWWLKAGTLLNPNTLYPAYPSSASKQLDISSKDHPSKGLYVIGITGTNGKTTIAHLIGRALEAAGHKPFVLGTLNSGDRNLSTPERQAIYKFMADHVKRGGTHFVMEVTSEAIDQARILGVDFNLKILSNITHDHLDYHKTFASYRKVKLSFMSDGGACKIYPDDFCNEVINYPVQLMGEFNLLNIKAASVALRQVGLDEKSIRDGLSSCPAPRGRLDSVDKGQPFLVLVDYAHTPDGLESVLSAAKKMADVRGGKLRVLFGCGGNRDGEKRPKMGRIASDIADTVVITDDNPRSELSSKILAEIVCGLTLGFRQYVVIADRKVAIKHIIGQAEEHDVVILAGKGHEEYQILATRTIHFDDREEAIDALALREKLAS